MCYIQIHQFNTRVVYCEPLSTIHYPLSTIHWLIVVFSLSSQAVGCASIHQKEGKLTLSIRLHLCEYSIVPPSHYSVVTVTVCHRLASSCLHSRGTWDFSAARILNVPLPPGELLAVFDGEGPSPHLERSPASASAQPGSP